MTIKTILMVLYLLVGLFFCGAVWRLSEEMKSDVASGITMILALLYIILWPILLVVGLGRNLAGKVLENENESSESTGEEMGVRD